MRAPLFRLDGVLDPLWRSVTPPAEKKQQREPYGRKRGRFVPLPPVNRQRVVVRSSMGRRNAKVDYPGARFLKGLRDHLSYMQRGDRAQEGVFDRDGKVEDPREVIESWAGDQVYYRWSINPEHANRIEDLEGYVREVMGEFEMATLWPEDLEAGNRLHWLAVVHDDIGRRHAHVLMRGQIGREELYFTQSFATHGLSSIAEAVATDYLGPRSPAELALQREQKVSRSIDFERG